MIFWLLGHVDNRMVGLWVAVDDGGGRGDGVLPPDGGRGGVERLGGGHHRHGGAVGAHDHVVDAVGRAKVQAIVTQLFVYTTTLKNKNNKL